MTSVAHPPMNVAVVGCGLLARGAHIPNLVQDPAFHLKTLCDLDPDALDASLRIAPDAATTRDWREVFADPEIEMVVVATIETFRLPLYRAAIDSGKPIYTEKPLAGTLEDGRIAAREVTRAGLPFCVGHNRRCSPAMVDAQNWFARHRKTPNTCPWRFDRPGFDQIDTFGQDGAAAMVMRINDDWHSWKAQHTFSSEIAKRFAGMLYEMTHFVDLARWFLKSEAESVCAMSHGPLNYGAMFHFEDRSMLTIAAGSNGTFGYPKELLEVMANGGMLVVDHMLEVRTAGIADAPARKVYPPTRDSYPAVGTEGGFAGWREKHAAACVDAVSKGDPMWQVVSVSTDKGHARMLREFAREIRGERPPVSTAADGFQAARMCFAAIQSALEGRTVRMNELIDID